MGALGGSWSRAATPGPVVHLLRVWENYLLGYEDRTSPSPSRTTGCPAPVSPPQPPTASPSATGGLERGDEPIEIVIEPFGPMPAAPVAG